MMPRVRLELTMQFDPNDPAELSQVAEEMAKGMTAQELTALWDLLDQAIRHPAHLEKVRAHSELVRAAPGLAVP